VNVYSLVADATRPRLSGYSESHHKEEEMKNMLIVWLIAVGLCGCASTIAPSFTLKYSTSNCPANGSTCLIRHPTSAIQATEGTVVRLSVRSAYVAKLVESRATKEGYIGNRELLLYAKIYKNGQFLRYSKITDVAEHMAAYEPVVVQKPVFFTEPVDGYYHIILKGYEVDTKTLVKALRRVRNTDVESLEKAGYSPGDTFMTGLKDMVFGIFDMVLAITGRTLDDLAAKINADKIFEHSIYVTPGGAASGTDKIVVLGSGDSSYFVKAGAENDAIINKHVQTQLQTLEGKTITEADLINGKASELLGSTYIFIQGERLGNP